jgi:hypothetical protein
MVRIRLSRRFRVGIREYASGWWSVRLTWLRLDRRG